MPITQAEVTWALAAFAERTEIYKLARDYYHGKQNLELSTKKFQNTFGQLFANFAYNRCRPVVDAQANRMRVAGFKVSGVDLQNLAFLPMGATSQTPGAAQAQDTGQSGTDYGAQAMALWRLAGMDRREGELYTEAGITGDAYGVVYYDAPPPWGTGLPRIYPNRADVMRVRYDDDGHITLAAKAWAVTSGPDAGKMRLTFYTPMEIIKLVTSQKTEELPKELAQYTLVREVNALGQPVANPIPHNLGRVPVVHYPNNAPMVGDYGISELTDVIPIQDALNKSIADLLVAMESSAFRQRYAIGIDRPTIREDGTAELPFTSGPGELWWTTNDAAKFGSFDASDLEQFLAVSREFDLDIARVSFTPVHWLIMTGTPPSGESLKVAEGPFVAKLLDRTRAMGAAHAEALAIQFQLLGIKDPLLIEPEWESLESHSQREGVELGKQMVDAGIPLSIAARFMGLAEQDLAELEALDAEAASSQAEATATLAAQGMAAQLMAGGNGPAA